MKYKKHKFVITEVSFFDKNNMQRIYKIGDRININPNVKDEFLRIISIESSNDGDGELLIKTENSGLTKISKKQIIDIIFGLEKEKNGD